MGMKIPGDWINVEGVTVHQRAKVFGCHCYVYGVGGVQAVAQHRCTLYVHHVPVHYVERGFYTKYIGPLACAGN